MDTPRASDVTLKVDHLVARYGERTILSGVDLEVRRGEVRVILGGSGCGKSTLLKHCIGLLRPSSGKIDLLGVDLAHADEAERETVLSRVGMLFQGGALLNSMTIHENVALPILQKLELPRPVVDEMARMKLGLVGLDRFGHLFPPELSGGMRKRAALARAMALDPEILFCDEPSAGLDPISSAQLDLLLVNLKDRFGMSVIVVTHELSSIHAIADRATMLDKGKVVADGTLEEVKGAVDPVVRAFFDRRGEAEASKASVLEALGES